MSSHPEYLLIVSIGGGTPEVVKFSDFANRQKAAAAGGSGYRVLAEIAEDFQTRSKTVSDCDRKNCTYYTHYQVLYKPTEENPLQLPHEAYHAAENRCEIAQKRYIEFLEDPVRSGRPIPEHLEQVAAFWERKICA